LNSAEYPLLGFRNECNLNPLVETKNQRRHETTSEVLLLPKPTHAFRHETWPGRQTIAGMSRILSLGSILPPAHCSFHLTPASALTNFQNEAMRAASWNSSMRAIFPSRKPMTWRYFPLSTCPVA
jgi:hypothetical protein